LILSVQHAESLSPFCFHQGLPLLLGSEWNFWPHVWNFTSTNNKL